MFESQNAKRWAVKLNALTQMRAKNLAAGKHADGQGLWLFKRSKVAGKWIVRLKSMKAGGPHVMTVEDAKTKLTLSNVMVGEVWLCSG